MFKEHGNIILHQIIDDGKISIKEVKPFLNDLPLPKALCLNKEKKLEWISFQFEGLNNINIFNDNGIIKIDASVDTRVIINDKIKDTNIFYKDDRLGLGRSPLYTYRLDIAIPENTLMTGFHIGDGNYGFSMGNGTNEGFVPEIIGMGSDENDAGLYFVGKSGNNKASNIPLIILDARNRLNKKITNRPIFGVTNSQYSEYKFLIDQNGLIGIGKIPKINTLEVSGNIQAKDFVLDSSLSISKLVDIIIEQNNEIDIIKNKLSKLEKLIKI